MDRREIEVELDRPLFSPSEKGIILLYNGRRIPLGTTPREIGLVDGAKLDVIIKPLFSLKSAGINSIVEKNEFLIL